MHNPISIRDRIRGSLIGGGVGDALGYAVEFIGESGIFQKFGPGGITCYDLSPGGRALISDDTQMTLFTANALLFAFQRELERGIPTNLSYCALHAYRAWYKTQLGPYNPENRIPDDERGETSFLLQDVAELYHGRAPGLTCMSAIQKRSTQLEDSVRITSFMQNKINDSKGCGGVMRVAPLGLAVQNWGWERLAVEGAELAAITHSHPLGYIPAACLSLILNDIVYPRRNRSLQQIIERARNRTADLFRDEPHVRYHTDLITRAIELSKNKKSDLDNIQNLGQGWVAEETLAIAIYCSLKYQNDFSAAVIAAVNHQGDSDSTGAVTGNILGAWVGYDAIGEKWTANLELHDLIVSVADRLCNNLRT